MATNNEKIVERTRAISRVLTAAIEEARACNKEFISVGGTAWTDPYFYVNGDINGALRTDLDITKTAFANAQSGLDGIQAAADIFLAFLNKVK